MEQFNNQKSSSRKKHRMEEQEREKQQKIKRVENEFSEFLQKEEKSIKTHSESKNCCELKRVLDELSSDNQKKNKRLSDKFRVELSQLSEQWGSEQMSSLSMLSHNHNLNLNLNHNHNQQDSLQSKLDTFGDSMNQHQRDNELQVIHYKELKHTYDSLNQDIHIMKERTREINQLINKFHQQDNKLSTNITHLALQHKQTTNNNTYIQQFFLEDNSNREKIITKLQQDLDKDKPNTQILALEYSQLQENIEHRNNQLKLQQGKIKVLDQIANKTRDKFNSLNDLVYQMDTLTQINGLFEEQNRMDTIQLTQEKSDKDQEINNQEQQQNTLDNKQNTQEQQQNTQENTIEVQQNTYNSQQSDKKMKRYDRTVKKTQEVSQENRTMQTYTVKEELDIHERLSAFHEQFKSVHDLEKIIIIKLQTDYLKRRSLQNMFRSLTENRKQQRSELYALSSQLMEQEQIDQTLQLEVEFYVFQDEYQNMQEDGEGLQSVGKYMDSLEERLDGAQGYSLNLKDINNELQQHEMQKSQDNLQANITFSLKVLLFLNQLLSYFANLGAKLFQFQDRLGLNCHPDEHTFYKDGVHWLYVSRDFQLMQQHLADPATELNQKELLYSYLMKNYKAENQNSNDQALGKDINNNNKFRSIVKKFISLYPDGENEARQFIENISIDQIMFAFADSIHFTEFMQKIHTLFINNYDLKQIKKDESKYYLLFLQCNFQKFSNHFTSLFNQQIQFIFEKLTSFFNQVNSINIQKHNPDTIIRKHSKKKTFTDFFFNSNNIDEEALNINLSDVDRINTSNNLSTSIKTQHNINDFISKQQSMYIDKKKQTNSNPKSNQQQDRKNINQGNLKMQEDNHILYPNYWEDYYSYGKIIEEMSSEHNRQDTNRKQNKNNKIQKVDNYIANLKEKKNFNNQLYIEAKQKLSGNNLVSKHLKSLQDLQEQLPILRPNIEILQMKQQKQKQNLQKLLESENKRAPKNEMNMRNLNVKSCQKLRRDNGSQVVKSRQFKDENYVNHDYLTNLTNTQKNTSNASLKSGEKVEQQIENKSQKNVQKRKHNPYQKEIDLIKKKLGNNKQQKTKLPTIPSNRNISEYQNSQT